MEFICYLFKGIQAHSLNFCRYVNKALTYLDLFKLISCIVALQ